MTEKKRVMIVEDEGVTAMSIQANIEAMGHIVTSMEVTGENAIEKAAADRPDLILMDILLNGEMDGIEAAGEIRSRFNIPVIYITAHSDKTILDRIKTTEPFGYIVKPFYENELRIAVELGLYKHKMESILRESEKKYRHLAEEREILINELKQALAKVNTLSGMLPICASCKKIRNDEGYWQQVADYISMHSDIEFTHGICPECAKMLYPDYFKDSE